MSYQTEFHERLKALRKRAFEAGVSVSALCEETGVARSTPDRWAKQTPKTIVALSELELALERAEKRAAEKQA